VKYTVKVEGLKDLDAALGVLTKAAARSTLTRVLKKAAEPIRESAEEAAPVRDASAPDVYYGGAKVGKGRRRAPGERGKLRRPGTDKALWQAGTRLTRPQAAKVRKAGKNFAEYYVGSRDPIARLLEFGTVNSPAQPMIRPAWDAHKANTLQIIIRELGAEIDKSVQRQVRKVARAAAKG
jgi:HK97 gp10 family phage protein